VLLRSAPPSSGLTPLAVLLSSAPPSSGLTPLAFALWATLAGNVLALGLIFALGPACGNPHAAHFCRFGQRSLERLLLASAGFHDRPLPNRLAVLKCRERAASFDCRSRTASLH